MIPKDFKGLRPTKLLQRIPCDSKIFLMSLANRVAQKYSKESQSIPNDSKGYQKAWQKQSQFPKVLLLVKKVTSPPPSSPNNSKDSNI